MRLKCGCIEALEADILDTEDACNVSCEKFGTTYSSFTIQPFRKSDGKPARRFRYKAVDWKFCPFCGEPIE